VSARKTERRGLLGAMREECGSVLMEGVLVLPLYLVLLGALFVVGDLAMGHQTLMSIERSVTWLEGDRFVDHGRGKIEEMVMSFLNIRKRDQLPTWTVAEDERGLLRPGNWWLGGFKGGGLLWVDVPWWSKVANAGQIAQSRGRMPLESELAFKDGYLLPSAPEWRSYVVRRRRADLPLLCNRDGSGVLLASLIMPGVVVEPWLDNADYPYHVVPLPIGAFPALPYVRENDLVEWGE